MIQDIKKRLRAAYMLGFRDAVGDGMARLTRRTETAYGQGFVAGREALRRAGEAADAYAEGALS
ncbi:MAG: hypothetical protein V3W41_22270 [Planctomycetota bacterium]